MEHASGAAKVTKNGWPGKISLSSFGCSYSSRDFFCAGLHPLTSLPCVGMNKQACSAEGWKASSAFGDLVRLPASHCINLQSA